MTFRYFLYVSLLTATISTNLLLDISLTRATLSGFLSNFSASHCFFHAINFPRWDINVDSNLPLIIFGVQDGSTIYNYPSWLPVGGNFSNAKISHSCSKISKFLHYDDFTHDGHCLRINFTLFVMNSKPWNCQFNIGISPPAYFLIESVNKPEESTYPRVWQHKMPNSDSIPIIIEGIQNFPSVLPTINIIYLNKHQDCCGRLSHFGSPWASSVIFFKNSQTDILNEMFYIVSICLDNRFRFIMKQFDGLVNNWHNFIVSEITFENINKLVTSSYWKFKKKSQNVVEYTSLKKVIDMNRIFKASCYGKSYPNMFKSRQNRIEEPRYTAAKKIILLWLHIMGNYSYGTTYNYTCHNSKIQHLGHIDPNVYGAIAVDGRLGLWTPSSVSQFTLTDTFVSLRFVTCGRAIYSGDSFTQLFSVFSWYVWLCIFSTTILLFSHLYIQAYYKRNLHSSACYYQLLGILVEKSIKFRANVNLALGIYIIMAVILSNGYKGENMYNVISPRLLIPYETFSQIVSSKYSLYT